MLGQYDETNHGCPWKQAGDPNAETRMLAAAKQSDDLRIQAETLFGKAIRMYHALLFG